MAKIIEAPVTVVLDVGEVWQLRRLAIAIHGPDAKDWTNAAQAEYAIDLLKRLSDMSSDLNHNITRWDVINDEWSMGLAREPEKNL